MLNVLQTELEEVWALGAGGRDRTRAGRGTPGNEDRGLTTGDNRYQPQVCGQLIMKVSNVNAAFSVSNACDKSLSSNNNYINQVPTQSQTRELGSWAVSQWVNVFFTSTF